MEGTVASPVLLSPRLAALAALGVLAACRPSAGAAAHSDAGPDAEAPAIASASPGEAPSGEPVTAPSAGGGPELGVTAFVTTVYKEPRDTSKKLGYLRVGARVRRSQEPAGTAGCPGGWYGVKPRGYVCVGKDATIDMDDPILKAASKRPNLKTALPYRYAFVRAVLPLYLRVPTADEQTKSEFKLKEHLDWYKENAASADKVTLGANDVALDDRGVAIPGKKLGELGLGKNSLELPAGALLGGDGDDDPIPFWLQGGKRVVPNISDFAVPDYAVFADRARRHTGLALVGSFTTGAEAFSRRFAITTDLRLAPATKIKADTGSPWHGIELGPELTLPLAFVRSQSAREYRIQKGQVSPAGEVEFRSAHPLVGKMKTVAGVKYYKTRDKHWLAQQDVGLVVAPASWPEDANKGQKWIEISITNQTLVLWEGKTPVYATLISSGKAGMDDPKTTTATVRGTFKIRNKHISATMDSNESSAVGGRAATTALASVRTSAKDDDDKPAKGANPKDDKAAKGPKPKDGKDAKGAAKPGEYVPRKGDGEYGVTKRRGEGTFALHDVPYIQYFASGYALHAAYWHDVFGTPRSHGCVNLSPIDAHRVFFWTDPPVPEGWHAVNSNDETGEGTTVIIHE
jgi:lipoprotein-anchoring transpeptidase ErfK/SrfK